MNGAIECPNCAGSERWYHRKHRFIRNAATAYGKDLEAAFVVYAVLSTNATVAENDKNFLRWCRGESPRHFGTVLARVKLATDGDLESALAFKTGRKIVSFRENLRWPWRKHGAVTIDRHAADVITLDRVMSKNWLARKGGYEKLEEIYRETRPVGWRPHEWQARVWVHHVYCNERKVSNG